MRLYGMEVTIARPALEEIFAFAQACDQEISGFGKVGRDTKGFKISEIFIHKQVVSPVSTGLDPETVYKAFSEEAAQGKDTSNWDLWWHSHVNMKTWFSERDMRTIGLLTNARPLISIVVNKRCEYNCRIDWASSENDYKLAITQVKLNIAEQPNLSIVEACRQKIKQLVKFIG